MVRGIQLCLLSLTLASCARQPTPPATFAAAEEAVRAVCIAPTSHQEIAKTVRALNWRQLARDQIPEQVVGNGMVEWSNVALAPEGHAMVAAGRLGGTSYCRVYLRETSEAPLALTFERTSLFGRPLGQPDFREHIQGSRVTGWHKGGEDWRAVHVWEAEPDGLAAERMPLMIEVTRAAT